MSEPQISILTKRADFVRASNARRQGTKGVHLQARKRREDDVSATPIRVGYTCSKKVGNAVARNRAKRRLRAAAQEVLPKLGHPGWDYVLVGRHASTAARDWGDLIKDLEFAMKKVHG
ncbi:ribonuclease P protein component [Shimia ponticola]|uniref:ribonuclease P protein component n=1 Tax=Shimia ponticola TaxID=2582893 RepID=UPI00321192EE